MMDLTHMNLQGRVERYKQRRFQTSEAEIIVLIEESAVALFNAYPDRFVLFGGASLLLFYESPRLSRDLDLLASHGQAPPSQEIEAVVLSGLQPIAEALGLGTLQFQKYADVPDFTKHWVLANQKPLFSIDVTRIGGAIPETHIINQSISATPAAMVVTPNSNYLLFQKLETFLNRRPVKARDAFDIRLLLSQGAQLDGQLHAHLDDSIRMKELHEEEIDARIKAITNKLCIAELRAVLPPSVFQGLADDEFHTIRSSLRRVFANWLQEVPDELDDDPHGRST